MSDMALRLDHVSRHFGKVKAVDDPSLQKQNQQLVAQFAETAKK